jgi:hypothetical protein
MEEDWSLPEVALVAVEPWLCPLVSVFTDAPFDAPG